MTFPRSSVNRRIPGRKLAPHIGDALDLIGQAIESADLAQMQGPAFLEQHLRRSRELYERARLHCVESSAESAHLCATACVAAIERLDLAIAQQGHAVDITAALKPDLGRAAARARRQEAADEAKREASRRENVAAYNKRTHDVELTTLTRLLAPGVLRPGCGARAIGERIRADLESGTRRGVSEEMWRNFKAACRREGVE